MRPLKSSPAIARLPIVRVLNRLATVIAFLLLVYLLTILVSIMEFWHRPPARFNHAPGAAAAAGNPLAGVREYRRVLPVIVGAPCVLVVHGAEGLGLIASRMVCNGRVCRETDLKIDRRGRVVCTREAVR